MKKIFLVFTLSIFMSCGPSVCESLEILEKSVDSDYTHGSTLALTVGQNAAQDWNDSVDAAVEKMLGYKDNPYTGLNQISQNIEWNKKRIYKAYEKAKQECK